jgi:hypothetical protein
MNDRRRALLLVVVAFVAAGLVVSSMRSGEAPATSAATADPRPPKPVHAPSGAVAIEAPPSLDGGAAIVPLRIDPAAFDAGPVRRAPIDPETGRPLKPSHVREGAHSGQPIPRRVIDRGAL